MVLLNTAHYKESNEKRNLIYSYTHVRFNYYTTFTCVQNISYIARLIHLSVLIFTPKFKSRFKLDLNFTSFSISSIIYCRDCYVCTIKTFLYAYIY